MKITSTAISVLVLLASLQSVTAFCQTSQPQASDAPEQRTEDTDSTTTLNDSHQGAKANTIYKVVADDGSVTFTDKPSANATPMSFDGKTQNVVTAATPPTVPPPLPEKKKPNYAVSILTPAPEATIRNNLGELTIRAAQPNAPKAPLYRLIFDNAQYASNSSGIFKLEGINRGAHTFKVELTNNTGKTLASSPLQTLYLHQASALINN